LAKLQKQEDDAKRRFDMIQNEYGRLQREMSAREEEFNHERERFEQSMESDKAQWTKDKDALNSQLAVSKAEQDRLTAQYQELVATVKKVPIQNYCI
jgi:uncharacterized protein (DUF3084 family)